MKILTLGMSPYLLLSKSKIHAVVLKTLYLSGFEVASLSYAHDTNYFLPEEKDGKKYYYWENQEVKIPVIPFDRGKNEVVSIYETIQALQPDVVISIGDIEDCLPMHAVRKFSSINFKWIAVLMNSRFPVNDKVAAIFQDMDAVITTCEQSEREAVRHGAARVSLNYVGSDESFNYAPREPQDKLKIVSVAKNSQSENIVTLIETVKRMHDSGMGVELYLHTNLHDRLVDYDLQYLKSKLDPKDDFLRFPVEYVGVLDGVPQDAVVKIFQQSDVFVSIPMVCPSALTAFEAIACGCYPVLSDCGANRDIARILSVTGAACDDFLVPTIKLMTTGESYLHIIDPDVLYYKLKNIYDNNIKGRGMVFSECISKYRHWDFAKKLIQIVEDSSRFSTILNLEH